MSPTELLVGLATANTLFWSLLGLRVYRRESEWLKWATWAVAVPLLALGASALAHWLVPAEVAVVVVPEAEVRAGDDNDAVLRFVVHEGTEVVFVQRSGEWVRVALSDGQGGWVKAKSLR